MPHSGTAHKYTAKLIAFEHVGLHSATNDAETNTLLWIGGLGDGLLTVQYPSTIAAALGRTWCIAEVLLSSSYRGWGTSSLQRDAREIALCVGYFQNLRPQGKVVLMGHSTGCQDIMEYLVGGGHAEHPPIAGAILQGSVSDREAWAFLLSSEEEKESCANVLAEAQRLIAAGKERELVPRENNIVQKELGAAISAYRTNSLLAKGGDDDYFSTDLDDQTLKESFGRIPKDVSIMFLLGSEDPFVHTSTDKQALLDRWAGFVKEGGGSVDEVHGGVIEGGHHNLDGDPEEVVGDLVKRVVKFAEGLGKSKEGESRL
ncbi:DUF1749-domain-containing protein [Didymella exigua CBS 183.55]|uniref:DUF1749-domain-containing protein n=1 Tax=Didymella exigua CBS 183.55 TaxID=1150837 RepID=A0A6A5RL72_9PLEO|nr:DUF1749-domain-containing protein [Didymella exigua CBS 183.55]KAF1927724.1 DUF1749-domain-containing protein [Didymella exigua CBS 183.55]